MPIKWTKELNKELSRQVKRFNAKVEREAAKHPGMRIVYPQRLTVREAKEQITNLRDYNTFKRSIDRAFEPGALDLKETKGGVTTTNWQIRELKLKVRRINYARAKTLEQIKNVRALPTAYISDYETSLQKKKAAVDKLDMRAWEKFVKSVEKQSKANYKQSVGDARKEGYIRGFINAFGDIPEILDEIRSWDWKKFTFAYLNHPEFIPSYYYDAHTSQEVLLNHLREAIDNLNTEWSKLQES